MDYVEFDLGVEVKDFYVYELKDFLCVLIIYLFYFNCSSFLLFLYIFM